MNVCVNTAEEMFTSIFAIILEIEVTLYFDRSRLRPHEPTMLKTKHESQRRSGASPLRIVPSRILTQTVSLYRSTLLS